VLLREDIPPEGASAAAPSHTRRPVLGVQHLPEIVYTKARRGPLGAHARNLQLITSKANPRGSDLLRRHVIRHGESGDAVPSSRARRACDACHVNKTKCDSVDRLGCLLCEKRGIQCSYRTSRVSPEVTDAPANFLARSSTSQAPFCLSTSHSSAIMQPEIVPAARKVLEAILEALSSTSCNAIDDIGVFEATGGASEWLTSCRQSYLDQFHYLWPILHMPTFDETREPLILGAIVVITGASLQGQNDKRDKELVTAIYEKLADRLSAKMVSSTVSPLRSGKSLD